MNAIKLWGRGNSFYFLGGAFLLMAHLLPCAVNAETSNIPSVALVQPMEKSDTLSAIQELLVAKLSGKADVRLLERQDLKRLFDEQGLLLKDRQGQPGSNAFELTRADYLGVLQASNRLCSFRLLNVKTGELLVYRLLEINLDVNQMAEVLFQEINLALKHASKQRHTLGLSRLMSRDPDPSFDYLQELLSKRLMIQLSNSMNAILLERESLDDILTEGDLTGGKEDNIVQGASILGGVFWIERSPEAISIRLEWAPEKGPVLDLARSQITFPLSEIDKGIQSMADQIVSVLAKAPVTNSLPANVTATSPKVPPVDEAMHYLKKGDAFMTQHDPYNAFDMYEAAMLLDRENATYRDKYQNLKDKILNEGYKQGESYLWHTRKKKWQAELIDTCVQKITNAMNAPEDKTAEWENDIQRTLQAGYASDPEGRSRMTHLMTTLLGYYSYRIQNKMVINALNSGHATKALFTRFWWYDVPAIDCLSYYNPICCNASEGERQEFHKLQIETIKLCFQLFGYLEDRDWVHDPAWMDPSNAQWQEKYLYQALHDIIASPYMGTPKEHQKSAYPLLDKITFPWRKNPDFLIRFFAFYSYICNNGDTQSGPNLSRDIYNQEGAEAIIQDALYIDNYTSLAMAKNAVIYFIAAASKGPSPQNVYFIRQILESYMDKEPYVYNPLFHEMALSLCANGFNVLLNDQNGAFIVKYVQYAARQHAPELIRLRSFCIDRLDPKRNYGRNARENMIRWMESQPTWLAAWLKTDSSNKAEQILMPK